MDIERFVLEGPAGTAAVGRGQGVGGGDGRAGRPGRRSQAFGWRHGAGAGAVRVLFRLSVVWVALCCGVAKPRREASSARLVLGLVVAPGAAARRRLGEGGPKGSAVPQLRAAGNTAIEKASFDETVGGGAGVGQLAAGTDSRSRVREAVGRGSDGTPFLAVSSMPFIQGLEAPADAAAFASLCRLVQSYVEVCSARGATFIADFEGEMPGYGGELVTAAFLATDAFDEVSCSPKDVKVVDKSWGLLLDLRSPACAQIVKHIMESPTIHKIMWGATGDVQSLMYQQAPFPLAIHPVAIVDIQLAYSKPELRMGMRRMLEQVPTSLLTNIPDKGQIDFDKFHVLNQRAMPLPLNRSNAVYAIDDLRRIEAILKSQVPPGRSYKVARARTLQSILEIAGDKLGLKDLRDSEMYFQRSKKIGGVRCQAKAVALMRHIQSLRLRGENITTELDTIERDAAAVLPNGFVIPEDLSFRA
mmetsp:Transcript_128720/g.412346  ORF Transcript_128720/g.412346 Transcript_128720/m.412346 type:complete len:473 (+) Transcript_128720:74-1492(+)